MVLNVILYFGSVPNNLDDFENEFKLLNIKYLSNRCNYNLIYVL